MKKVLIIAYHFPPINGGGVFRTLKFVKYLPNYDWKPFVVSVKNPRYRPLDTSLLEEIPNEAVVQRVFSFESRFFIYPFNKLGISPLWIFIPDVYIGFLFFGLLTALRLIKKHKIDLIYTTGPPFTSLIMGYVLKKLTKKPLIVDFRDPWTQNICLRSPSPTHRKIIELLEFLIVRSADAVITSTKPIGKNLLRKYPSISEKKFKDITNGYDPEDFIDFIQKKDDSKFHISHAGLFFSDVQPTSFLNAMRELIRSGQIKKNEVKVTFIGSKWDISPNDSELNGVIKNYGWVSHKNSLELLSVSDVLFLMRSSKGFEASIPAKVFEYLVLKKPILALIPEGAAAKLIRANKAGLVVNPDDLKSIKNAILNLFKLWKEHNLKVEEPLNLGKYDRRILTKKLASILNILYLTKKRVCYLENI